MSQPSFTGNFDVVSLVKGVNLRRVAQCALVVFFLGLFLVPLETGIITVIKTNESVARSLPLASLVGEGLILGNIRFILEQLSGSFFDSLIMSIPTTTGGILFGSMATYGPTMVNWRAQMGTLMLPVADALVPYQVVLVPLAHFWNNILPLMRMIEPMMASMPFSQGYHAEFVSFVITRITYGIPIYTMPFRSYYQSLPNSLMEAGKIDGASVTEIYRRVILLISKPVFSIVFTHQFAQIYNEFLFMLMLITGSDVPVVSVTLVLLVIGASTSGINSSIRMSAALLVAVPTLILYIVFVKRFIKGLRTEA